MDWNQSKLGYYLDFVLVPLLVLTVLTIFFSDLTLASALAAAVGFVVWTLAEYWIHRSLLHRVLRKEHWLHHKRPGDFVAAPAWITALLHIVALGASLASLGRAAGAGFFAGLEAGYLLYIWVHDRIHHRRRHKVFGRMRRLWDHHMLHHGGAEVNFGVASHFWDHVFGTYRDPRRGRKGT